MSDRLISKKKKSQRSPVVCVHIHLRFVGGSRTVRTVCVE